MKQPGAGDEYSLIKKYGGPQDERAQRLIKTHWDTFVQREHLDTLRKFGFTHVRIPIGYWMLESDSQAVAEGFVPGGEEYLRRAIGWLKERGMKAVLDLHAMPGAQAKWAGFTGKRLPQAGFFLNPEDYERGLRAVDALCELVLRYENSSNTSGTVVGIEPLNEPDDRFWGTRPGAQHFYETMIPKIRESLPADKYMILLSFMDSPHVKTSEWFASVRARDPESFAGVAFDQHLYHTFGDNKAPWSPHVDTCKTCCRDMQIMKPMWSAGIPIVVGEWGLSTGFWGWDQDGFASAFAENQLALWDATPGLLGSFAWNFRLLLDPQDPDNSREWSWVDLIQSGLLAADAGLSPKLTGSCPAIREALSVECPRFERAVAWDTPCEWVPRHRPSNASNASRREEVPAVPTPTRPAMLRGGGAV